MGLGSSTLLEDSEKEQVACMCNQLESCEAKEHRCSCCKFLCENTVLVENIKVCKSLDYHDCICRTVIVGSELERGNKYCRDNFHGCCCDLTDPQECRSRIHLYCNCLSSGPDKCRVDSTEHFCSCWMYGPETCRIRGREHDCFCSVDITGCKCRYGYHTCICPTDKCRSRIHTSTIYPL